MKTPEQLRATRRQRDAKATHARLLAEHKEQNIASIEAEITQINDFEMPLQMAMFCFLLVPDVSESCRLSNRLGELQCKLDELRRL